MSQSRAPYTESDTGKRVEIIDRDALPDEAGELLEPDAETHVDATTETILVPLVDVDVPPNGNPECSHVWRINGYRLLALEPHPGSGYWECCPGCGMPVDQRNAGAVPADLVV